MGEWHWGKRGAGRGGDASDALAGLPGTEWTVWHDVAFPGRGRTAIDHVVVGPSGLYVISTLDWSGRITAHGGALRQHGRRREPVVRRTREATAAVAGLIPAITPTQIHGVLCFVRDEPLTGLARDVLLGSTSNLVDLLQTRPRVWTEWARSDVARQLGLRLAIQAPTARDRGSARASYPTPLPSYGRDLLRPRP